MTNRGGESASPVDARWTILRAALGVGQAFGATVAVIALLTQGATPAALAATVITSVLTMTSVLLCGRRSPHDKR
jgi:hypothetical protein